MQILALVHYFVLNSKQDWLLAHNPVQDCNSTFNGVIMSAHISTPVTCILEELDIVCQLLFSLLALFWADLTPHVGHNDKGLQCAVTAELPEHSEVLHYYASN